MMRISFPNDLGNIINDVSVIDEKENIKLLHKGNNEFFIEIGDEEAFKYQLLINNKFIIPDLNNNFAIEDNIIYSVAKQQINTSYPSLDSITLSKELSLMKDSIIPISKSNVFNSLDETINVLCDFSNVKSDFVLLLEIFTSKKILGVIPAFIPKGTSKNKYKRFYFCSLDASNFFGINDLITVRIKMSHSFHDKISFRFNTIQNYKHPQKI